MTRRKLLAGSVLAGSVMWIGQAAADDRDGVLQQRLAGLERRHGGRLGVAILDTADGRLITRRGGERFAMCSTFKFLAAAFVLARVDRAQENLGRRIVYSRNVLLPHSPITGRHVGGTGMTVASICEAAMTQSDNAAANLLLDSFGGPAALTAHLRSIGDGVTRLDRREPGLNEDKPGDPRDTTTPVAMLQDLHRIILGDVLSASSRAQLAAWLVANRTGDQRLRAGVPKSWRAGDRTGSGATALNDIAVIWPPGRPPIIVTAYYDGAGGSDEEQEMVLSEVGRLAASV